MARAEPLVQRQADVPVGVRCVVVEPGNILACRQKQGTSMNHDGLCENSLIFCGPYLCEQILLRNWRVLRLPPVEYAEPLAEGDGLVGEQVPDADASLGMTSMVEIIHKMSHL